MLLHKIRIIPTAVPVTKPKQNLGEKSLRRPKTNKIPFKTNKILINFKQPLNRYEDFLGFVHKKNKCTKPSSKLLKDFLIVIERFLCFFIWNLKGKCLDLQQKKQAVEMMIYCLSCLFCLFLVFDFLFVLVVSCSRNVEFFNQLNIRIGSIE